jgi:hypothetical protein
MQHIFSAEFLNCSTYSSVSIYEFQPALNMHDRVSRKVVTGIFNDILKCGDIMDYL